MNVREPARRSVPYEAPRHETLRHAAEFGQMACVVKSRLKGRTAAFLTNPGNLGDALIGAGALSFLDANGIAYHVHDSRLLRELHAKHYKPAYAKHRGLEILSLGRYTRYSLSLAEMSRAYEVAIICGSGGFAEQAHVAMQIQELCSNRFAEVIVLPTTYAIAPRPTPNTVFFARDTFESMAIAPFASFCHDTAFFLQPGQVAPTQRRVGYHLRTDNESSGRLPVPASNFDISAAGTERDAPTRLFDEVARSEVIVTDRLHVCIAAALVGRSVYLFAGNYFKIPAIYRSSIAPYFPNVVLLRRWEELPACMRT